MSSRRSEEIESHLGADEKNSIVFRHATAEPEDPWLRRFDVPRFSFGKRSTTSYGVLVPGRPSRITRVTHGPWRFGVLTKMTRAVAGEVERSAIVETKRPETRLG